MNQRDLHARLLGGLEATVGGRQVQLAGRRAPQVLAYLLLRSGLVVSTDRLVDAIWGDNPPASARNSIQRFVSDLRRAFGDASDRIETSSQGYRIQLGDGDSFDVADLERRVSAADTSLAERRPDRAIVDLGPVPDPQLHPLADLDGAAFVVGEQPALVELIARANEIAIDARLGIGDVDTAVMRSRKLLAHHPHREQVCIRLACALAAGGRSGDALDELAAFRRRLREELGLDPSPALIEAERSILNDEAALPRAAPIPKRSIRSSLPAPLDAFIGRKDEMAELTGFMESSRLVTVAGPGGTGKTRLAVEAALHLTDRYPDGAAFVALAPVIDENLVPAAFAEALGLSSVETDIERLLVDHLRSTSMLLVVDNCEHVLDRVAGLVRRLLAGAPGVTVLATSREPLGIRGEVVDRLQSLRVTAPVGESPPAVALFVERALSVRPQWQPSPVDLEAIAAVCTKVAGIPLAIELVAARVRSASPVELLALLEAHSTAVFAADRADTPRHQTLDTSIEWSFDLLGPAEQTVFLRAAAFVDTFDLDAALAICAGPKVSESAVVAAVDALVDRSLVLVHGNEPTTRYRLLEPVRQWATARLQQRDELDALRTRHAEWYADLIIELSGSYMSAGQADAFRRTRLEYANVHRAFESLASTGRIDRYLDCAFALFWFWAHQYGRADGYAICLRGLELAENGGGEPMARTKVAYVGALCAAWARSTDAAAIADRCAQLAAFTGDTRARGWAEHARSVVALNEEIGGGGDKERTATFIDNARTLLEREHGDLWWDPEWERGYRRLSFSTFGLQYPEQVDDFEESGRIFEAHGDEAGLAIHHAQCLQLAGLLDDALLMELVRRGAEVTTSPMWANRCQSRIGLLHQRSGDHARAIEAFERARAHERAVGGSSVGVESRHIIGSLTALGHHGAARAEATELLSNVTDTTSDEELRRSLTVAALVLVHHGHDERAAVALGASNGAFDSVIGPAPDARLLATLQDPALRELRQEGAALSRTAAVSHTLGALNETG